MTSFRFAILISTLLWVDLGIAQTELPADVQADIARAKQENEMRAVAKALAEERYQDALTGLGSLREEGIQLPPSADYVEGKAAAGVGDWVRAKAALQRYFDRTGQDGEYYKDAIQEFIRVEEAQKQAARQAAEKERRAAAEEKAQREAGRKRDQEIARQQEAERKSAAVREREQRKTALLSKYAVSFKDGLATHVRRSTFVDAGGRVNVFYSYVTKFEELHTYWKAKWVRLSLSKSAETVAHIEKHFAIDNQSGLVENVAPAANGDAFVTYSRYKQYTKKNAYIRQGGWVLQRLSSTGDVKWTSGRINDETPFHMIASGVSGDTLFTCGPRWRFGSKDGRVYIQPDAGIVSTNANDGSRIWRGNTFKSRDITESCTSISPIDSGSAIVTGFQGQQSHVAEVIGKDETRWMIEYAAPSADRTAFFDGLRSVNGETFAVGSASANGKESPLIVKVSSSGEFVWQKTYDFGATGRIVRVIAAEGGDIAVAGHSTDVTEIFLARLNQDGTLVISNTIKRGGDRLEANDLDRLDSGYVLSATRGNYDSSTAQIYYLTDAFEIGPPGGWDSVLGPVARQ